MTSPVHPPPRLQFLAMIGSCEQCGADFALKIYHNGFNDSSYAYCSGCGKTAFLSRWSKQWPEGVECTQAVIDPNMEPHLAACECGGRFVRNAAPRCPHCGHPLSADAAAEYIERQSPGSTTGWRWQRNWHGLYCIVVDDRMVEDSFIVRTSS